MNKRNKLTNRSEKGTLALNDDRGDATWQYERGPRYGNSRKARSLAKKQSRRKERRQTQILIEE